MLYVFGLALVSVGALAFAIWVVWKSSAQSLSTMLDHLEQTQTVGGSPVDMVRLQGQITAERTALESERSKFEMDMARAGVPAHISRGPTNGAVAPQDLVSAPPVWESSEEDPMSS